MTDATAQEKGTDLTQPYEPKPEERAAVAAYLGRKNTKPVAPRVTLTNKAGSVHVSTDHPMPGLGHTLAMHAIGVTDPDLFDGLLGQLVNVGTHGRKPNERGLNFMPP
jgi:hypothetical protein